MEGLYQLFECGKHSVAHHLCNVEDDFASSVSGIDALFASANRKDEGKAFLDGERNGSDGEALRVQIPDFGVLIVDVLSHSQNQRGKSNCFGEIGDEFSTLDSHEEVFVIEHRSGNGDYLLSVGLYLVLEGCDHSLQSLDHEVPVDFGQRVIHHDRENFDQNLLSAENLGLLRQSLQGLFPDFRISIFDLQEQSDDFQLHLLSLAHFLGLLQELPEVLQVILSHGWNFLVLQLRHNVLFILGTLKFVARVSVGLEFDVRWRRLHYLVAFCGKDGVQILI